MPTFDVLLRDGGNQCNDVHTLCVWNNVSVGCCDMLHFVSIIDFTCVSPPQHWCYYRSHCHWFASLLTDPNRVLLIGQRDGVPIGVVRFDIQHHQAEVSIYLVPGITGCGRDLLCSAEMWFVQNRLEVNSLHADVFGTNLRSHQLFLSAGYEIESTSYFKKL